ncbi:zinc finger CCCH domain-containing protein 16 [Euphorbia lathyris]|uniref:zinc finger CCCH domain-containing protein 16 n=1 Tax=Euphorbia lathyris TaxID=212925 RepID=UPI0033140B30
MPVKKELCRNFQRGSCQYGARCKFLHVNSQQQPRANNNAFGFGVPQKQQNQSSNPFGFGVQSKPSNDFSNNQQQFKPFENKWNRFSPISNPGTPSSKQSENQTQAPNHNCTDPNSCKRQIAEDYEREKPLWKLTCYGHSKDGPCDIVGDVSYEELRAAAYDDAKHGLSLQSIIERERNLLNSKLIEFENLLRNPYVAPQKSVRSHSSFPEVTPIGRLPTGQTNAPPAVSSFSQLGASLDKRPSAPSANVFGQPNLFSNTSQASNDFGIRPSVPLNNSFGQQNGFSNSGQTTSAFAISNFSPSNAGFGNSNAFSFPSNSSSAMSTQITNSFAAPSLITANTSNSSPNPVGMANTQVQSVNDMQERATVSVDPGIWLKENWVAGEIPEEAPPVEYV